MEIIAQYIEVYWCVIIGTGQLDDIGFGKGKYYTINVPLFDGIQDAQYIELVIP